MSEIAIKINNLGKMYKIGERQEKYATLRDTIASVLKNPFHRSNSKKNLVWALKNISLEVKKGEVVGIIGRNGAGKSTLLKILSRITEPTDGQAEIHGRVGSLLEVGTGFHPELTGRENIYLSAAILGMTKSEIDNKFDDIVAFAEVEKFIDTPVKRYSSGMYLRLAFAVAAHMETEILLVDEVLAVGDAAFQKKCLGMISKVAHQGRTVFFVSHNMGAIKALCSRAILVDQGSIKREGCVDEVINHYLSLGQEKLKHGHIPNDIYRTGTREILFRKVQMLKRSGESTEQVCFGEQFQVVLRFEVMKDIQDAVFGLMLTSVDGVKITSSYSTDGNQGPYKLTKGIYETTLDLDVTLIPRNYYLNISVSRSNGRDIDYIERAFYFNALDIAKDSKDRYPWPTKHGFIRPSGQWTAPKSFSRELL